MSFHGLLGIGVFSVGILLVYFGTVIVKPYERLVYRADGKWELLDGGVHFLRPLRETHRIDVRTHTLEVPTDEAIEGASELEESSIEQAELRTRDGEVPDLEVRGKVTVTDVQRLAESGYVSWYQRTYSSLSPRPSTRSSGPERPRR